MKKYVALILGVVLTATGISTNTVDASTSSVGFKLYGISDYNHSTLSNLQDVSSGGSCSVNTFECAAYCRFYNGLGKVYANIDGESSEECAVGTIKTSGNYTYTYVRIRYLSPGTHKVILTTNISDPTSTTVKYIQLKQTFYVTVPAYEDQDIKNSLVKINNGTATISDYQTVGVNPEKVSTRPGDRESLIVALNEKVKGKDLTISNVQSTVYKIIDERNALENVNTGTGDISCYTILGISGVTSDNLSNINSAIISAKTAKGSSLTLEEVQEVVDVQITTTTTSAAVTVQ